MNRRASSLFRWPAPRGERLRRRTARASVGQGLHAALLAFAAAPAVAFAQSSAEGAPSLLPTILALFLVLAMIPLAAWAMKKLAAGRATAPAELRLRVVAQLALGARERIVILEAGDRWLLLGVTSAAIHRIGTLPRPGASRAATAAAAEPALRELLGRIRAGQP